MSLEKQKELILAASELGESIPGLEPDAILNNLAEKSEELKAQSQIIEDEVNENVSRGMTEEEARQEADAKKKEAVDSFKANLKERVNEQVAIIKQQYKVFKESVEKIPEDVTTIVANIAIPPAISVPPSSANPAYALNLAKTSKNSLAGSLSVAIVAFTEMLKAATSILFEIPESILAIFESLKVALTLIESIPI